MSSSCLTPFEGLATKLSHHLDATVNVLELHHCNSSSPFLAGDVTRQLSSYFEADTESTIVAIGFGFTLLPAVTNQIININGLSPALFDYALDRDPREQYLYSFLRQPIELRYYANRRVDEAKAKVRGTCHNCAWSRANSSISLWQDEIEVYKDVLECKWAAKDFLKYSCKLGEATNDHANNFWSGWSTLMVDNLPQGTYLEGEARTLSDDTVIGLVSSSIAGTATTAPQPLVKFETIALCDATTGKKGLYYKSPNALGGTVTERKFIVQLADSAVGDPRASDLLSSDCDGILKDWGKIVVHPCGADSFLDSASRAVFEEVATALTGSDQIVVLGNSVSLSSVESYLLSNFPLSTLILESTFVLPGVQTSSQLVSDYSLDPSHPCAEDFNGRPCCYDLTCLGMKHSFPSLKVRSLAASGEHNQALL